MSKEVSRSTDGYEMRTEVTPQYDSCSTFVREIFSLFSKRCQHQTDDIYWFSSTASNATGSVSRMRSTYGELMPAIEA